MYVNECVSSIYDIDENTQKDILLGHKKAEPTQRFSFSYYHPSNLKTATA